MDLVAASPVPIPLPITDSAYERLLEQGTLGALLASRSCPLCKGSPELTARRRRRGGVREVNGRCVAGYWVVVLASCEHGHLLRVLPANALPRKVYSLEAQEAACRGYWEGHGGLRVAVRRLGYDAAHFTTVHGWLGGLGRFALGLETPTDCCPASVPLEETRRRAPECGRDALRDAPGLAPPQATNRWVWV